MSEFLNDLVVRIVDDAGPRPIAGFSRGEPKASPSAGNHS
jgi:hypothetical protein